LEFEKLSRGMRMPLAAEFVWGNTQIEAALTLSAAGTSDESVATAAANAVYGSLLSPAGPARVGILANSESSRAQAGAAFYGNLDLGGQVWERCVSVGNAEGRAFSGLHGNGLLPITGIADVSQWPDATALGTGFRGGSWQAAEERLQLADRNRAAETNADRLSDSGGRLARTYPSTSIVNGSGL
jgi:formylglycine-generating enzyme required for sulfatase activity